MSDRAGENPGNVASKVNGDRTTNLEFEGRRASVENHAVGVVASGTDDGVARVVMRARSNDYPVLVTTSGGRDATTVELAEIPGVYYIPTDAESGVDSTGAAARQRLAAAARALSFSGLVFVEDTAERIDFERSVDAADEYVKRAIPEEGGADVETLVAIPAYDEAKTIASVVEEALAVADDVVVVDDGSEDGTAQRAETAGATVVDHGRNLGYGAALQTAFETADRYGVETLVIIDGDGQHDANDIPALTDRVLDGDVNVAIGSRFAGARTSEIPLYRRFGLGVINLMSNVSMGAVRPRSWVSDTQSGFRAYDRHAIEELASTDIGDDMDASLDILYHLRKEGFEIEEVPTVVDYDVESGHSQNPVEHGMRLVRTILRTVERDHPVKFLGVPGFVMILLGFGLGYLTVANYLMSQTFPLVLALVSACLVLAGLFSGVTAATLHSLQTYFDG